MLHSKIYMIGWERMLGCIAVVLSIQVYLHLPCRRHVTPKNKFWVRKTAKYIPSRIFWANWGEGRGGETYIEKLHTLEQMRCRWRRDNTEKLHKMMSHQEEWEKQCPYATNLILLSRCMFFLEIVLTQKGKDLCMYKFVLFPSSVEWRMYMSGTISLSP